MTNPGLIRAIVAMNEQGIIGKGGGLPWHYSEDLKRFKRKTIGSTIIMGRKTWESIDSKPLPGRRNIVISSKPVTGVECYTSIENAVSRADGDIWIIGGGQIYSAALKFCDGLDVTWVPDRVYGEKLVRFPDIDPDKWHPGEKIVNELDDRLVHQIFTRKAHHTD